MPSFKREKLSFSNGTVNTANHGVFFPKPGKKSAPGLDWEFCSLKWGRKCAFFKTEKLSFSNGTINTANHGVIFPKPGKNLQLVEIGSFVPLMGKIF